MLLAKGDKKIYIGEDLREHVSRAQGLEKRSHCVGLDVPVKLLWQLRLYAIWTQNILTRLVSQQGTYINLWKSCVRICWHSTNGKQIVQRTVLYRGPSKALDNGVIYYNVEDFLCKLGEDPNFLVCDLKAEIERKQRGAELAQQEAVLKTERYPESEHETKLELDNVGDWTEDSCIEDTDIYNETDWCERQFSKRRVDGTALLLSRSTNRTSLLGCYRTPYRVLSRYCVSQVLVSQFFHMP